MLKTIIIEINLLFIMLGLTGGFLVLEKIVEKQANTVIEKEMNEKTGVINEVK